MVICLERGVNDLHMVWLMPLPPHHLIIIIIIWAGVQPTLDPYAEAFYSRPIALTLGGEEFQLMMYASVCVTVR